MLYHFVSESWVEAPLDRVFHFFADPDNLPRIMPAIQQARIERLELVPPPAHEGGLPIEAIAGEGSDLLVSFRAVPFHPVRVLWRARIVEFKWNSFFRDEQVEGPMKFWTHRHEFETSLHDGNEGTLVRDRVNYDPGFGPLGALADAFIIRHMLRSMFEVRKSRTSALLK